MSKDGNEIDINSISRYAKSIYEKYYNLSEAFAEIMTEAYGPTPGKQAIMFKKYFEKKALEVINDASSS